MKSIGVFVTEYSLLIFLLICKKWDQVTFIFFEGRIRFEVLQRLKDCGIGGRIGWRTAAYGQQIISQRQILRRGVYKFLRVLLQLRVFFLIRRFDKKSIRVYGQDHAPIASLFRSCNFTVIEDGMANYEDKNSIEKKYKMVCGLLPDERLPYLPFGWDDSISRVYLTGRAPLPEGIKKKCKIFDMRMLWNEKTEEEKKQLCYIFGFNMDYVRTVVRQGRDIFLLTQNLAPTFCTEMQQLSIYRKLLLDHDLNRVVIKPHPADRIAYEQHFPECVVMRGRFPFEFMYFMEIPIQKIIGINSTSLYGLWDSSIIESHEELLDELMREKERMIL